MAKVLNEKKRRCDVLAYGAIPELGFISGPIYNGKFTNSQIETLVMHNRIVKEIDPENPSRKVLLTKADYAPKFGPKAPEKEPVAPVSLTEEEVAIPADEAPAPEVESEPEVEEVEPEVDEEPETEADAEPEAEVPEETEEAAPATAEAPKSVAPIVNKSKKNKNKNKKAPVAEVPQGPATEEPITSADA